MHSNIRNRLFSLLLTFAMLCSLLPATALATEDGADSGTPVACTQGEGCEADSHDEGCPLYAEPEEETEDSVEDEPDDMTNAVIAALYPTEVVEDDPADVDSWKNCKTLLRKLLLCMSVSPVMTRTKETAIALPIKLKF